MNDDDDGGLVREGRERDWWSVAKYVRVYVNWNCICNLIWSYKSYIKCMPTGIHGSDQIQIADEPMFCQDHMTFSATGLG